MTIKSGILSTLAFALLFTACKKDKNTSNAELLEDSKWMMTAYTETVNEGNGIEFDDMYEDMQDCEKDDIIWLKKSGETANDQGTLKCDENEPQIVTYGTWKLVNNGKSIEFSRAGIDNYKSTVDILELTATTLKVKYGYSDDAVTYEEITTFKRVN